MSTHFWTDSHSHIYSKEFDNDRADMMQRALDANVCRIIMPNVDHTSIDGMFETELRWNTQCEATMGLHPCSVKKDFQRELYIVEEWLAKRKFSAVGEIGTDMYWDKTLWEEQREAFVIQVNWAKNYSLPVIIHCRETLNETIQLVEDLHDEKLTGVFHCFTGTLEQAQKIFDLGFYVGLGGVSTFKKSGLENVIPGIPVSRILLETDSPYLAPVPHRGKRNEPGYIPLIAEKIASLKGISLDVLREETMKNTEKLFPKKA